MALKSPLRGIQQYRRIYEDGILGQLDIIWLLNDSFNDTLAAGAVNGTPATPGPGTRTVVDTAGTLLSLSGGNLVVAGRTGTSDPALWLSSVTRVAGLLMVTHINLDNKNNRFQVGFGGVQSGSLADNHIYFDVGTLRANIATVIVGNYVAARDYYFAIVLKSTGAYHFIKEATDFPAWTLLWIDATRNTATEYPALAGRTSWAAGNNSMSFLRVPVQLWLPTPLAYDTFTRANGAIGSSEAVGPDLQSVMARIWTGATFTIATNKAINTPPLGVELATDPGLEGNYTGGLNDNLTTDGAPTVAQSGDVHGGSKAQSFTGTAATDGLKQGMPTTVDNWYQFSIWAKRTAGTNGDVRGRFFSRGTWWSFDIFDEASYTQHIVIAIASGSISWRLVYTSGVAWDTVIIDDFSAKQLTLSTLFSSLSTSTQDVVADVDLVIAGDITQAGLVLNLDDAATPANFLIAYHDGVKAHLEKCVAGTYTSLISAAATYAANATLRVIKDGTSVSLFYNNAKVGTTQTVSDAGIVDNTLHGLFSTYAANTMDNFTLFPRKTTYDRLNKWIG